MRPTQCKGLGSLGFSRLLLLFTLINHHKAALLLHSCLHACSDLLVTLAWQLVIASLSDSPSPADSCSMWLMFS